MGASRSGAAVAERELDADEMAIVREMTGTSGDSLSLVAERESLGGDSNEPTINSDSETTI